MQISADLFYASLGAAELNIKAAVGRFKSRNIIDIQMQGIVNQNLRQIQALKGDIEEGAKELVANLDITEWAKEILSTEGLSPRNYMFLQPRESISVSASSSGAVSSRRRLFDDSFAKVESLMMEIGPELINAMAYLEEQVDQYERDPNEIPVKFMEMMEKMKSALNGGKEVLKTADRHFNVLELRLVRALTGAEGGTEPNDIACLDNDHLRKEVERCVRESTLPQPVTDRAIIEEMNSLAPAVQQVILNRRDSSNLPLLQALTYMDRLNRSRESREDEIIPNVYVGNVDALKAIGSQRANNPKHFIGVISAISGEDEFREVPIPDGVIRQAVEVNDTDEAWAYLEAQFDYLFGMIDEARLVGEPILIHCVNGDSRSVTLMMAYLINRCRITPSDALTFIKTKRFVAEPTPALQARLEMYATSLEIGALS